jgi:hypothetical protein
MPQLHRCLAPFNRLLFSHCCSSRCAAQRRKHRPTQRLLQAPNTAARSLQLYFASGMRTEPWYLLQLHSAQLTHLLPSPL